MTTIFCEDSMNDIIEKYKIIGACCLNCNNLIKENTGCPLQPISFTCPVLNELACMHKTKVIKLKLDKMKEFLCDHHERKEKNDAKE